MIFNWSMSQEDTLRRGRHVVSALHVHLVFLTKYRRRVISEKIWPTLIAGFESAAAKLGVRMREVNHDGDHVHMLVEYPPSLSVSEITNALKGVSSRMVRRDCMSAIRQHLWGTHFWSPSYFASSSGGAPLDVIAAYVRDQRKEKPS